MEAVIFIGHGSRSTKGNEMFISLMNSVFEKVTLPIKQYAFLENSEPSIQNTLQSCVNQGATEIIIIPVLMLPGIHANEDIPNELSTFNKKYPHITLQYGVPLGEDNEMVLILEARLKEQGFSANPCKKIVLVGHGSRDPEAKLELETLGEKLEKHTNVTVVTCTLKASPYFKETVKKLVGKEKKYILPFFLFTGRFVDQISETIKDMGKLEDKLILCKPIGFDKKLVRQLVAKIDRTRNNPLLVWKGV